jgi:hypothetical protein
MTNNRKNNSSPETFVGTNAELNLYLQREDAERRAISEGAIGSEAEPDPASRGATNESPQAVPSASPTKRANRNALRHGAYCLGLLPWESPADFEALHKKFREDCKPTGALEEEAVLSLCQWMWKRRRVIQSSEIRYFRSPVTESLKAGEVSWDDVVQYEAQVPAEVQTLIASLTKLVESLTSASDKIGLHYYWTETTEGKDIQLQVGKMRRDVAALASGVSKCITDDDKNIRRAIEKITDLFDQAYQPDEIEKQARLLSMIDREIDKTIKRLIFLKTFSSDLALKFNHHHQPLLDSPPVTPNENGEEKVKPTED